MAATIVLMVVGTMMHDTRLWLIGAWPFAIFAIWEFSRTFSTANIVIFICTAIGAILSACLLTWLYFLLEPAPSLIATETTKNHTEPPKTLHDLYKTDFANLLKLSDVLRVTIGNSDGTFAYNMTFEVSIYFDYDANSKFYLFYIPKSPDNQSFNMCTHLAKEYPAIVKRVSDRVFTSVKERPGEPSISSTDLTFSGRIYLYHEDEMTFKQKAEVEDLFKSSGAHTIFRGLDYWQTRMIEDATKKHPIAQ